MTIERPPCTHRERGAPRTDSSLFRRLSERDPRDVIVPRAILTELFQEELHPDPEWMADLVIQRLHDGGFTIMPTKDVNHG